MAWRDRCRSCVTGITVEPVLFIYMLSSYLQFSATQALTFTKVCRLRLNDSRICDEMSHNDSLGTQEPEIQSETSLWILYASVSLTVPSIVTTTFIGSWGDQINRKLPLILPCIGGALAAISYLINSIFMTAPLPYLLVGPLLNGLSGGFVAMMMATYSYITYLTDSTSRTARVGVLEAMTYIAGALALVFLGVLLDGASFTILFSITTGLFLSTGIYAVICVPKISSTTISQQGTCSCGSYFNTSHITDSLKCMFKRRENKTRLTLWLLVTIVALLMISTVGLMDILLLFVKHSPLSWSYSYYGYLQGLHNGLRSLVLLTILPLLKKMEVKDVTLILLGLLSKASGLVLLGFSDKSWMVFLVPVLSMLEGLPSAGCRSMISTLVNPDEQGKVFGSLASIESLATLVASVTFNSLYSVTVSFYPGLAFQVMAGLCCVAILLLLPVCLLSSSTRHYTRLGGLNTQHDLSTTADGVASQETN